MFTKQCRTYTLKVPLIIHIYIFKMVPEKYYVLFPEKQLKIHMDSLRTTFGRINKPAPSGSGTKKLSARNSWIMRNLSFLGPYIKHRTSHNNLDDEDDDRDDDFDNDGQNVVISDDSEDNTASTSKVVDVDVHKSAGSHTESDEGSSGNVKLPPLPDLPPVNIDGSQSDAETCAPVPRRTLPKRPNIANIPKKSSKAKTSKRSADPGQDMLANVNTTIHDLGTKLLSHVEKTEPPKDDIKICVEGLESKIRNVKNRRNQLKLMWLLEREASKSVMDDYIQSESQMPVTVSTGSNIVGDHSLGYRATPNIAYCTPSVQPISPPLTSVGYNTYQFTQATTPFTGSVQYASQTQQPQLQSIIESAAQAANIVPSCVHSETSGSIPQMLYSTTTATVTTAASLPVNVIGYINTSVNTSTGVSPSIMSPTTSGTQGIAESIIENATQPF